MARPRPRVEGKPAPSVSERGGRSSASPSARVVPVPLSKNSLDAKRKIEGSFRSKAAQRLMSEKEEI